MKSNKESIPHGRDDFKEVGTIAILNGLDRADAKIDDHVGFALYLARDLASRAVAQQLSFDLKVAPVP